jgi:replicative DNA helicase
MTERTLPHNLEAERAVLGCLIVESDRLVEIADTLAAGDFFRVAHRSVFAAISALHSRRVAVDLITLREELARRSELDRVGGPGFVASLADGTPRGVNLAHYSRIVREKSQRRCLIFACNKALADAYEGEFTVEELIERTEADVFKVSQEIATGDFVQAREWVADTYRHLERLAADRREITGVPTGFYDLDRMTRGLQPGDLIIVGARPSMGKTAFALQLGIHAAGSMPVGMFSVEMARLPLGVRAFSVEGHINGMRLQTGRLNQSDYARVSNCAESLGALQFAIDESPILTPTQLRAKARRLQAKHGLSLLIIDYLQILDPGAGKHRAESRTIELAQMSRGLKQLARELGIPIVVLSQLSRKVEDRADKRPNLADLRESGAIEQDADVVLLLHRPEYYHANPRPEDVGKAEVIIAKQRNGPTGTVDLLFNREFVRFDNPELRTGAA